MKTYYEIESPHRLVKAAQVCHVNNQISKKGFHYVHFNGYAKYWRVKAANKPYCASFFVKDGEKIIFSPEWVFNDSFQAVKTKKEKAKLKTKVIQILLESEVSEYREIGRRHRGK